MMLAAITISEDLGRVIMAPVLGYALWSLKSFIDQRIDLKKTTINRGRRNVDDLTSIEEQFAALKVDLVKEIQTATYAISPGANGGKSLPDVADKVDKIMEHQTSNFQDIFERLGKLDGIWETHIHNHK